jgi:hypothetical protein
MKKQKRDWFALLTIYELDTGDLELQRRMINWLRKLADDIENGEPADFASPFRARLMK